MNSRFFCTGFAWFVMLLLIGCNDPFSGVEQHEKYQIPEELAEKLYTQVKAEEDLSTYASALEITGYDEIFDKSGSYTLLAPSNSAFELFFQDHPNYQSIEDVPVGTLTRMVKFLALQNSWNEEELRKLSANNGWGSDDTDEWKSSFVYKKETILEEEPRKVWMDEEGRIVDSLNASSYYLRPADYRKFMPVFTREYFEFNEVEKEDYELYFDRSIEINDDIYMAEAKIEGEGIFASNGFIYTIDRVVLPPDNTEEFLENNGTYSLFLALIREFSQGDQAYPYYVGSFQPGLEKINTTNERFPMYNHAGIVIPTNRAFISFIEDYLLPQGGLNGIPESFRELIANSFYVAGVNPIFTNELEKGFYNAAGEIVLLNQEKIVKETFASNATLIEYDDFIIPNIFTSVGAPLVLSNKYRLFLDAVLQSGADNALKAMDQDYSFYIVPDLKLEEDSSLYISDNNDRLTTFDYASSSEVQHSSTILKTRILNQVALGFPEGLATKEFLPNLAGNYIVAEKQLDGSVLFSGKEFSTFGYNQPDTSLRIKIYPQEITAYDIQNGKSFEANGWFNYSYRASDGIVDRLRYNYIEFFNALRQTGYLSQNEQEILFYNEDLQHTIFAPTDEAFLNSDFESLSPDEKKKFVKTHFVVGSIIFTDGKEPSDFYRTMAGGAINLDPGVDVIHLLEPDGSPYYTVDVASENSNVMLTTVKPEYDDDQQFTSYATTAVLHQIDTVLYTTILTE